MSLESEINKLITDFGNKLVTDLNASLNKALKEGGSSSPQEAALHFNPEYLITTEGTTLRINATADYWYWIEHGRKPGKMPPSSKLGKKWQNKQNIDPRKVVKEIQLNYFKKMGIKRNVKELSFDKAAKQLGFITARAIGKHGTKPRPYLDRVLKDGRIEALSKALGALFKKEIQVNVS